MKNCLKPSGVLQPYGYSQKQKGFGTIVFVMLVGLAVTATGASVLHSVANTQQKSIAVNSVTHSQTGVWVAAEAFRLYLEQLDSNGVTSLGDSLSIEMDASYGTLTASDIQVQDMGTGVFRVSTDIVNVHAAAKSSAALNVIYEVAPSDSSTTTTTTADQITSINFSDDISLDGGIELIGADGGTFAINVDGDVDLGGVSVNPLGSISATGTVTIGSSVTVENIYANDDVTLANTTVQSVSTLGDFVATGSASVDELRANGDITIDASGRFEAAYSLQNIYILTAGGSGHGYMNAGDTIEVQNAGPVDQLEAVGDIELNTWSTISDVVSMSDIYCVSQYWTNFTRLSANGLLHDCSTLESSRTTSEGASNLVTTMTPLEPYVQTSSAIDVWTVKSDANYVVSFDSDEDRIKVVVNNVSGISDGSEYFLADYSGGYKDYLCSSQTGASNCRSPSDPLVPLCLGYSVYNSCISYTSSDNTFKIVPSNTAPGIMFFDGNLELESGFSKTSYLASGDIGTGGSFKSEAANNAAYDKVCLADASHISDSTVQQRYTEAYSEYYPSNLCNIDDGLYIAISTGNIGLAAGGIDPDGDGSYAGGDISLGASTEVTGAVLAGNTLETSGETKIYGAVASGAAGDEPTDGNSLGGSTTIDLSKGTDTYDPTSLPDMSGETTTTEDSGDGTSEARMLWVKYL